MTIVTSLLRTNLLCSKPDTRIHMYESGCIQCRYIGIRLCCQHTGIGDLLVEP